MSKRRRTEFQRVTRSRPINKELVSIAKDGIAATQVSSILITATFPCTITGLRWELAFINQSGTAGITALHWVIAIVREGVVAATIGITELATLFTPEENVMAFGVHQFDQNGGNEPSIQVSGSTKTMRKLQTGDTLQLLMLGTATNLQKLRGVVQFFCMT